MLCQNCEKQEATTHIKRVINGDTTESHLCSKCAEQLGYSDFLSGFSFNFGDFFGDFLGDAKRLALAGNAERCPKCGNSFSDIVRDGRVGCAECYRKFYDKLCPSLERIHGRTRHNGKRIEQRAAAEEKRDIQKEISMIKKQLDEAVKAQEFEKAAQYRDKIKELEAEQKGQ